MTTPNTLQPQLSPPSAKLQLSALSSLSKSTPDLSDSENSKKAGKWTSEEDELLRKYVSMYSEKQWKKISEHIPGRTSIQCLHRWTKILKPGLVKGPWTQEEDQKLLAWIKKHGPGKWAQAANLIPGRSGKQCRERWSNNLNPDVRKGNWSPEEDELIFELYQKHGSSWSKISKYIPGRTENSIKNRFYSTLRKLAAAKNKNNAGSVGSDTRSNESNAEGRQEDLMMKQEEGLTDKKVLQPLLARNSNVKESVRKEEVKKSVVKSVSEENETGAVPEFLVEQQRILNSLMLSLKGQNELGLAVPLQQQGDLYRDLLQNQLKLSVPAQIAPLSVRINEGIKPLGLAQNYQQMVKPQGLGLFGDNGNLDALIGSVSSNILTATLVYNHYLENINEIVKNNEGKNSEEAKERVTVLLRQLFALESWLNNAKLELIRLQGLVQNQNLLAQLPLEASLLNKRKFVDENIEGHLLKKRKVD